LILKDTCERAKLFRMDTIAPCAGGCGGNLAKKASSSEHFDILYMVALPLAAIVYYADIRYWESKLLAFAKHRSEICWERE
jgi:hypothetical protein